MLAEQRPNPDHLLAQVQAEEKQRGRGKLKVFLGYAAGVGKTYAMLEAAQQRRAEGVDVVAAYVETHGRAETDVLLEGLEAIPRQCVEYRDTRLEELDLDATLARRPQLALVDELAHTNAPGSRHPKRYQDVEELLAAGIDVYTTLNIQHLESANDVVAQITGVVVRETIPDRIIDEADEIELVDLPPDELLQRLREGKVYVPDQAARAVERFFRKGNLTALREMALRRAALRVDDQMRAYMQMRSIPGPWAASERLLVCVSPNPLNQRLVRTTRRLADELKAEWFALYVETPQHATLSPQERDRVARNLQLAEELGAKVATRPAESVADAVVSFARDHNVTKIIAGKPLRPRWIELFRGSVLDQIVRKSGPIDVYVISGPADQPPREEPTSGRARIRWRPYGWSVALVAAATVISYFVHSHIEPANLVMLYLLAVVGAAVYLGRGPAILASVLGVVAFDFFLIPPKLTLVVANTQYILTFVALFVVGLVISSLAARVRSEAEAAHRREAHTTQLYELSRDLAAAPTQEAILETVILHVSQTFDAAAAVLMPEEGVLRVQAASPGVFLEEDERAVASWAWEHRQAAGEGTENVPSATMRYLPLETARGVVGVLAVGPSEPDRTETPERRRLLESFASQAALAIERGQLAERAGQLDVLSASEKLHTTLLNSISHELRTPLAAITGVLSSLREAERTSDRSAGFDDATRAQLIDTASQEAERLNRLVGNLLDMTRLESGALKVNAEPCEVQDLVGTALGQLAHRLGDRPIELHLAPDLPLVPMDFVLMAQVLANLLDNAAKYSPPEAPLEVGARVSDGEAEITVADRGEGIEPADLERVFDKFYRVRGPGEAGGIGLGLAISRGIVEAHGGRIEARNRPGGGTIIQVTLPLEQDARSGGSAP